MEIRINEIIRNKRRSMNVSQEVLAERLGVTVQAVSKWETGLSYPDITMLPRLAEYFEITLDGLFFGNEERGALKGVPDDGKLRIVQCMGGKVLGQNEYKKNEKIRLIIPETEKKEISFEIWGGVDMIEGDVGGYVEAGMGVSCGAVGAYVEAGGGVNCGDVGAYVEAGRGVNCGDVGAYVGAGGGVSCGDIGGNVQAGGDVGCGSVDGDVSAGNNVTCTSISGNVSCEGDIIYKNFS